MERRRLRWGSILGTLLLVAACTPGDGPPDTGAPEEDAGLPPDTAEVPDSAETPIRVALPALFAIMAGLERDAAALSRGLWREDFGTIAEAAAAIAEHPAIPAAEGERIAAVLGPDMGRFQALDEEVHDLAQLIRERATARDLQGIADADADLRRACVQCHQEFRDRLRSAIR